MINNNSIFNQIKWKITHILFQKNLILVQFSISSQKITCHKTKFRSINFTNLSFYPKYWSRIQLWKYINQIFKIQYQIKLHAIQHMNFLNTSQYFIHYLFWPSVDISLRCISNFAIKFHIQNASFPWINLSFCCSTSHRNFSIFGSSTNNFPFITWNKSVKLFFDKVCVYFDSFQNATCANINSRGVAIAL
jgi:hypothetical protein